MSCRLLPASGFPAIAPRWDHLNTQHYRHPLLESRFYQAALQHLSRGDEQIALCETAQETSAIAIIRSKKFGTWTTFQPSQAPMGALIKAPGLLPTNLAADLLRVLPPSCQLLALTQQDPHIVARPDNGAKLKTLDYIDTARITVDSPFDEYWAGRGKNLRHNIKRQRNRLKRDGIELRVDVLTDHDQISEGIRLYGALESRGWKAQGGTAIHPDNKQGRFYLDLLERYATTGSARIYLCYYSDRLAAVDLCILNQTALVILKTTYDETISTSSPAMVMRSEYFRPIFDEQQVERIEFYGKVMDWHTKWSNEIRRMYHLNAYRSSLLAWLHSQGM